MALGSGHTYTYTHTLPPASDPEALGVAGAEAAWLPCAHGVP